MAEYISREDAIKAVINKPMWGTAAEVFLQRVPAADVVEVKHGRWIFGVTMHHEWMKCSVCNVSQDPNGCFSYCPNCGAKMDGGADDDNHL